jgi:phage tail-like protein
MDANGLRFWLLADERDWHRVPASPDEPPPITYDGARRTLRLASRLADATFDADGLPARWTEDEADAALRLDVITQSRDAFATRAFWEPDLGSVVAAGAVSGVSPLFTPAPGRVPSDIVVGHDGILYLAFGDRIVLVDVRERWQPFELFTGDLDAWRLAADPAGGVWILDRDARTLARLRGEPSHDRPATPYLSSTFRPCEENADPPRLARTIVDAWPIGEDGVAIACAPDGRVAVLTWRDPGAALLHLYDPTRAAPQRASLVLAGVRRPYSVAFLDANRIAVLLAGVAEAPVFSLVDAGARALPVGDFHPLRDHDDGPFVHGVTLPPHYGVTTGESTLPLHRLSKPAFARTGEAANLMLLDASNVGTVWHRLYLEAAIPPGCAVTARLAASDDSAAPMDAELWYDHRFGGGAPSNPDLPRGVWLPEASELPFQPGLLACPRARGRSGLFTALVQRGPSPSFGGGSGRAVRALRGRYLWVRLILDGTGAATPEVAALRAYGGRFSYRDQYLPELYRESVFGDEAEARGRSTRADFLERFLDTFESVLTPLEDRVAHTYLLTDASAAPEEALDWLGSWIGFSLDPAYPRLRRRALLRAAPELFRWRGTVGGIERALDLVTDGAVTGGEIVVVEDFRLRRTFATILGADLSDDDDPLLGGLSASGNSIVGDTLFLGEESKKEFLALFRADLEVSASEQSAIASFLDRVAHRITVLVHQEVEPQDVGLIRRVVELEAPAHLETRIETASEALLVGVRSLVGIDTYLTPKPPRRAVRVGRSRLGHRDFLIRPPSLDPRLEGDVP